MSSAAADVSVPATAWTIKMLWVGSVLSTIERLALSSFLHHGHEVHLFTYEPVNGVPEGVLVRDANEILPESSIFQYAGRRSYAAFANWFRYEMLLREGGVWVDTDVVCLKPFDFEIQPVFGREQADRVNNAVLGGDAGLELFAELGRLAADPNLLLPSDTVREKRRKLRRRYLQGNRRGNIRWGETGPQALTRAAQALGCFDRALPVTAFYPIHSLCWTTIFDETYPSPERYFPDSYAIHLWNEMLRRTPGFEKDRTYPSNSLIEELKRRYL